MIYCNVEFFLLFFATFVSYLLWPNKSFRFAVLLAASAFFYAWAGTLDTLIFAFVILCSWLAVALAARHPRRRATFIGTGIVLMLAHLFFWKYASWIIGEVQSLWPQFLYGREVALPLPVGISFFTLQGVAYLVDFQRGQAGYMSLREYALFKGFFPQLVAGPIVRSKQLLPQLRSLSTPTCADIAVGLGLFIRGLSKKLLIADLVSPFVDTVFSMPGTYARTALLSAAILYSAQIWADFSGYTDMGRGAARMLGFTLPENFLSPYLALSPSEFWRRWHITLSQWIRDYIYIPLGGNRGSRMRVAGVTFMAMAISGFWHGANWTFLFWGAYHGLLLLGERSWRASRMARFLAGYLTKWARTVFAWGLMTAFTLVGWILFRAENIQVFTKYVGGLIRGGGSMPFPGPLSLLLFVVIFCMGMQVVFYRDLEQEDYPAARLWSRLLADPELKSLQHPKTIRAAGTLAGIALAAASTLVFLGRMENVAPFIYFQF